MNRKLLVLAVIIFSFLLNSCTTAPGIPGVNVTASNNSTPPKERVDYKLVVINAKTIQNQKRFDYNAYIEKNKKRNKVISHLKKQPRNYSNNNDISNSAVYSSYKSKKIEDKQRVSTESLSFKNTKTHYRYVIGKKDILSIIVWDHPELTLPNESSISAGHIVDSTGHVYFPYAGKIYVAGKTTSDVQSILERKLTKFITKPQITVRVANYRSQKVYVSGAVLKPHTISITDVPLTIRDALSKAGGVSPDLFIGFASLTRGKTKVTIDLNRLLKNNDNKQNFLLKNNDRLHILAKDEYEEWKKILSRKIQTEKALNPLKLKFELQKERSLALLRKELEQDKRSEQAKIFVMGEVHKPGSIKYQVRDGMTLAEAINDSGSFIEESVNPQGVFLIRKESKEDNIPTVYQLPLASVHSMLLAEQFEVRPRDIIYVTTTSSIRWNRILTQLVPTLTLVNTITNLTK